MYRKPQSRCLCFISLLSSVSGSTSQGWLSICKVIVLLWDNLGEIQQALTDGMTEILHPLYLLWKGWLQLWFLNYEAQRGLAADTLEQHQSAKSHGGREGGGNTTSRLQCLCPCHLCRPGGKHVPFQGTAQELHILHIYTCILHCAIYSHTHSHSQMASTQPFQHKLF